MIKTNLLCNYSATDLSAFGGFTQTRPPLRGTSGQVTADRFKYSNYPGTEGQRYSGAKIFARPANLYMFLLCPKKPGPLGQVRDRWLCPGVLCLKKERRTPVRLASESVADRSNPGRLWRRRRRPGFIFFMQNKSPPGIAKA